MIAGSAGGRKGRRRAAATAHAVGASGSGARKRVLLRDYGTMRSRARRWRRTAFLLALIFGGMAVGGRFLLGGWPFDGAPELPVICLAAGAYFHILSRRFPTLPDPTERMQGALQMAAQGRIEDAIAGLSDAIAQSPSLWQAFQYRGELYLLQQNGTAAAADFEAAIRLAPREQHLYGLREQARSLTNS